MNDNEQTPLLEPNDESKRARRAFIIKFAIGFTAAALALWIVGDVYSKHHHKNKVASLPPYVCGNPDKSSSGYIKLANKVDDHYFYWFFEAEEDTGKEPLVMWLQGGPGSSSLYSVVDENGPCTINADLSTTPNPYTWSRNANVIWLDQPTGVGYSFGAPQDEDYDETDVGANIYWFLQGFLNKYPQFEGREFYVTGESYGGHYVPGAGHYIWQQTKQQLANPSEFNTSIINIKGIAIGNGFTNPVIQLAHIPDMVENQYNVTVLTPAQAEQMKKDTVECIELVKECQLTTLNNTPCALAVECWDEKPISPFYDMKNHDFYNILHECNNTDPNSCDDTQYKYIRNYLNLPEVRKYLNADPRVAEWRGSSEEVHTVFLGRDCMLSHHTYVADMLNDGLRVLIYAGDTDLACNWIGNRAWTLALEWSGTEGYNAARERPFITHDPMVANPPAVEAGVVRSYENFAFVRLYNAGHFVPSDQPAVSLELINKFLYGQAY